MKQLFLGALALVLAPSVVLAAPVAELSTAPVAAAAPAGPILSGAVKVAVRQETLPAGGKMAEHRQDALRYLYVVSGRLKVSDLVTGEEQVVEAGAMATEAPGDWHVAQALGATPVTVYVIDPTPQQAAN